MGVDGTEKTLTVRQQLFVNRFRGNILRPAEDESNAAVKGGGKTIITRVEDGEQQKKLNHYKNQFNQDCYLSSEEYELIKQNETLMPLNCLSSDRESKEIQQITRDIEQCVKQYYQGEATLDDIAQQYKQAFDVVWERNVVETQRTTGENLKENLQMLSNIYTKFKSDIVTTAVEFNQKEGNDLVDALNIDMSTCRQFYYNAQYYYDSEAALAKLEEAVLETAEQYKIEPVNVKNFKVAKKFQNSFNESWNTILGIPLQGLYMRNVNIVPPKGSSFLIVTEGWALTRLEVKLPGVNISIKAPAEAELMYKTYSLGDVIKLNGQGIDRQSQAFLDNIFINRFFSRC